MRKLDIVFLLEETGRRLFTTEDLRKLFRIKKSNTLYKTVESLIGEKILLPVSKGKYIFRNTSPHDFEVANFLYPPSYISFESALAFHNVLVQAPYNIISATPLRNKKVVSNNKEYIYVHVTPKAYFGYVKEGSFLISSPEKALLDALYLMSKGLRRLDIADLDLSDINKNRVRFILKRISNKRLENFVRKVLK